MDSKQLNRILSNAEAAGREDSRWKDERIAELEAEREEAARLLRMVEPLVDNFTATSEPLESIRKWLTKIDKENSDDS